jgi:hypothetical protein
MASTKIQPLQPADDRNRGHGETGEMPTFLAYHHYLVLKQLDLWHPIDDSGRYKHIICPLRIVANCRGPELERAQT